MESIKATYRFLFSYYLIKIIRWSFVILVSLFVILSTLLRIPVVQTFIASETAKYLSTVLETDVKIERLVISPYLFIEIENALIKDKHDANMIKAGKIRIQIDQLRLRKLQADIGSVKLENICVIVKKYPGDTSYNIVSLFSPLMSGKTIETKKPKPYMPFLVRCRKLELDTVKFVYDNDNKRREGFDWNYMDFDVTKLYIEDIFAGPDSLAGYITEGTVCDKSGFEVEEMSLLFSYTSTDWDFHNALFKTKNSKLDLDFAFDYKNFAAFSNFVEDVTMSATIRPSYVNFTDIEYFSSTLKDLPNTIDVEGNMSGPVCNMKMQDIRLSFGDSTKLIGNFGMEGLPDNKNTTYNFRIDSLLFLPTDLPKFKFGIGKNIDSLVLPSTFSEIGLININGKIDGKIDDFSSKLNILSAYGELITDVSMKTPKESDIYSYNSHIYANNLDVGSIFKLKSIVGITSFGVSLEGSGFNLDDLDLEINGVIDSVLLNNYNYKNINIDGIFQQKMFNGTLSIIENNIDFAFDGEIGLNQEIPTFNFNADIKHANLGKLKLFSRKDPLNKASVKAEINFIGFEPDSISGYIKLDTLWYSEGGKDYSIEKIDLFTKIDDSLRVIAITSDILDLDINGKFTFSTIISSLRNTLGNKFNFLPYYKDRDIDFAKRDELSFALKIKDATPLSELFAPSFSIKKELKIEGKINTQNDSITISGGCPLIYYNKFRVENWKMKLNSEFNTICLENSIEKLFFKEPTLSDSISYGIENLVFSNRLINDNLTFDIDWKNSSEKKTNSGDINIAVDFSHFPETNISILPSKAVINDTIWEIPKWNQIKIDSSSNIVIEDFLLESGKKSLKISGDIGADSTKKLQIDVNELDLSSLDLIWRHYNLDFDGIINGYIKSNKVLGKSQFFSDITIDGFKMNNENLGHTVLKSIWNNSDKALMINASSTIIGKNVTTYPFNLAGNYYPFRKNNSLDFNLSMDNLQLKLAEPFVRQFVSKPEGFVSGNITLKGSIQKPQLDGKIDLKRGEMRIKYLNTRYAFTGSVEINNELISLDGLTLSDTLGNSARLEGGILHKDFDDIVCNLTIRPDNFICLNTNKFQNSQFYGNAVATGLVTVKGPFDDINLNIEVKTEGGTNISVPISTTLDVEENTFVIFVNDSIKNDTLNTINNTTKQSSFTLDMGVKVDQLSTINVFLPSKMGKIQASGEGTIKMLLDKSNKFSIFGEYYIKKGTFLFQFRNIINRQLKLKSGSKIIFDGDPMDSRMNVTTVYDLRTTLSGLDLPLDSATLNTRIPVECVIKLDGKLSNPSITFGVRFPSLESGMLQMIYSKLDTTNEVDMTKQVFSLLVLNNFSFTTGASNAIVNNLGVSTFTIVSGQISNWLSQISKDVDIGFNYQPGDDISADQMQLALSTQFFNNRVTVNGDLGYSSSGYNQNTNNLVGDVDIEVKITPDGRFKIFVFNRANNDDLLNGGYTNSHGYTQGIGVSYGKDFDKLSDLFKRKKEKKEERRETKRDEEKVKENDEEKEKSE